MRFLVPAALASWLVGCAAMAIDAPVPNGEGTIYVVERGWHTDIGLPVDMVSEPLALLERPFPGIRFMLFGFGERHYYMAQEAGSAEMLTALLPSDSAILMTALRAPPAEAFSAEQVIVLHLPRSDVGRLALLLWTQLEKSADGSVVRIGNGPYPGSVFYASTEIYDAFHTCNTWTALMLRNAGFPIDTNVLFAGQVMRQVARLAAMQAR